jgi:hypothetical protein
MALYSVGKQLGFAMRVIQNTRNILYRKNTELFIVNGMPSPIVSIVQKIPKYLNELFWKQGRRCKVCGREHGFITMAIKAIC